MNFRTAFWLVLLVAVSALAESCMGHNPQPEWRAVNQTDLPLAITSNGSRLGVVASGAQKRFIPGSGFENEDEFVIKGYEFVLAESGSFRWLVDGERLKGKHGRLVFCREYPGDLVWEKVEVQLTENVPFDVYDSLSDPCPDP